MNLCWVTDPQSYSTSEYSILKSTIEACEKECGPITGILNTGDHSQQYKVPSSNVNEWGYCLDSMSKWTTSIPYTPVVGNHDKVDTMFYNHFNVKLPSYCTDTTNGFYYSYDIGDVHFTIINTNDTLTTSTPLSDNQLTWLEEDLKNSTATWKILLTHKGFYTTGRHVLEGDIELLRRDVLPLISKYHVDLVLQGHDHVYSRTNEYAWDSDGKTPKTNVTYETENIDNYSYQYAVNPKGTYYAIVNTACGHANNVSPVLDNSKLPSYFSLATSRINGNFLNIQPNTAMYGNISIKDGKLLLKSYQVINGKSVLYDYIGISKRTASYLESLAKDLPASFDTSKMVEITKAVSVYEELSEEQKALLSEETKNKIISLAKVVRIQNYIDSRSVVNMIDHLLLPTLTSEYFETLKEIEDAYNSLSALTKKYVNNYSKYQAYKEEYENRKEAKLVDDEIKTLGEITSKDDPSINACINNYNNLTENQKKYVSNYYALLLKALKVGISI